MFGNWKNFIVIVIAIMFASCSLIDIEGLRPDVVPNAPGVPIVEAANRLLSVNWQTVKGARSYEVWAGTTNNSGAATKRDGDVSGLSANITGLINDTTYYVWVKAKNKAGTSDFSPVASGTPSAFAVTPLTPQTAPVVVAGSEQLTISWEAIEGARSYEVWTGTTSNSNMAIKQGEDVSSLYTIITGLNNNTTYFVWIKAKNNVGTSGFSPVASGTPLVFTEAPLAPQIAPAIVVGNGQFTISWEAVEKAITYEVWIGTMNNSNMATKRGDDVSGLSTVITGLNNGTVYYVWTKAKNNIGTSDFSPVANGKPLGTPGMPTVIPGNSQLLVTWTAVAGADEYEVYYGIGTPATLAITTTETSTIITGLTDGTTYQVRLRAKNASGISDFGPSASIAPGMSPGLYQSVEKIGDQNLSAALSWLSVNAISGGDYFIVLGTDELASGISLSFGKTVKITLLGYNGEKTISLNANGRMFTVSTGVTLTFDENITLFGRSTNNDSLVYVDGGNLIINDGAKITGNNIGSSGYGGGGIYVSNGTLTMNGGTIDNNTISSSNYTGGGGGVYVSGGTFMMNGGLISGNKALRSQPYTLYGGGGVCVSDGTFTMKGGTISGNISSGSSGGGVRVYGGAFAKTGGLITGYSAGDTNSNIVVTNSGQVNNNCGHAVHAGVKYKETTAGQGDNLSWNNGVAIGAWDN